MAQRKKSGSAPKSPPAKRTPKSGGAARRPKQQQPRMTKEEAMQKKIRELELIKQRNQIMAVVIFAAAVLMACVVLIPGENIWNWLHVQIMGLFGVCAIMWPVLLLYISIVTAFERYSNKMSAKIALMVVIILLLCGAVYIFSYEPGELGFGDLIVKLYTDGSARRGAGFFGGLIGYPVVLGLGAIGGKIVIILLLFVAVMILTGTSMVKLFRAVAKPAAMVGTAVGTARERRQEIHRRQTNIDIALDKDELPMHPVQSPKTKNEKLEKLEKVFDINKPSGAPAAEPQREIQPGVQEARAEQAPAVARENGEDAAAGSFLSRRASKEEKEAAKKKEKGVIGTPVPEELLNEPASPAPASSPHFPPVSMLEATKEADEGDVTNELQTSGRMLTETLKSFGVQTKIIDISRGPSVTRYELQPAPGVKISKITNLADDIAMNLAATGVRIEAPIPGKAAVGIEVPNQRVTTVRMRELIESNSFQTAKSPLTVVLGRDIAGSVTVADLAKMPHLLIAGTTGSGKSVCINAMIISLLYKSTPEDVRFLMIDPKVVELGVYNGLPHLLVPVVTDPRKAAGALNWAVTEMLKRYKIFADCNVRDLSGYNALAASCNYTDDQGQPMLHMPQIVIIVDELADLMMAAPNEVEDSICRLAQMARAAGMHLVIATQRPSVDVITGLIKANIPSRIALTVSSQVDSRTILDMGGAEKLLGRGDMLFAPIGSQKPIRVQGCFVSDNEIESIAGFMKSEGNHEYDAGIIEEIEKNAVEDKGKAEGGIASEDTDPMIPDAVKCVVESGQASTSLLQRRLHVGYARAGRLIDEMEQMGIVGPHEGSKPRQVLITYQQWLEMNMQKPDEPSVKPE